jgi:phosphate transport system substrate-binding protein
MSLFAERIVRWTAASAGLLALWAGVGSSASSREQTKPEQKEALAIIVNRSNPVTKLTLSEVRRIFLGEQGHWANGHRITVVMLDQGWPERKAALKSIYRMNESDFKRYFVQATFTGAVFSPPKTLATPEGARKFILNLPSAIGYVAAGQVDDTVKVVQVDGQLPGEKGYKLRLDEP